MKFNVFALVILVLALSGIANSESSKEFAPVEKSADGCTGCTPPAVKLSGCNCTYTNDDYYFDDVFYDDYYFEENSSSLFVVPRQLPNAPRPTSQQWIFLLLVGFVIIALVVIRNTSAGRTVFRHIGDLASIIGLALALVVIGFSNGWLPPILAFKSIAVSSSPEFEHQRMLFQKACSHGDSASCVHLGYMAWEGLGGLQDSKLARESFSSGCERGEATSCAFLGIMFSEGLGGTEDEQSASTAFRRSCELKESAGCFNMGVILEFPDAGRKANPEALTHYQLSCDLGEGMGCYRLAILYETGINELLSQDKVRAKRLYGLACQQSLDIACKRASNL
tara:strand:+ start:400 stop:1410 length:1011 start_codon:yes stop_codon:yes gene_type:complete